MMKDIRILLLLTLSVLFGLTSCEESGEAGEFDNWQQRNTQFIDSIARVARANTYGDWKVFLVQGLTAPRCGVTVTMYIAVCLRRAAAQPIRYSPTV